MRSVVLSVVLMMLLCLGATPVVATGTVAEAEGLTDSTPTATALDSPTQQPLSALSSDADDMPMTTFTVNLRSNQDAEWVVTIEYDLQTESEQTAFEATAQEFEDGTAPDGGLSVEVYENMAGFASEETDREMAIEDVERTASLEGTTGTLRLAFTWRAFLEEDGEQLIFNDALQSPDDCTWLTSLEENQALEITTPRGYAITSANVGFTDNTVTIEGPYTFDQDDHVRITLEPSAFGGTAWELLGAAVVVAAAIIGGAFLLRRRENTPTEPTQTTTTTETTAQPSEPPEAEPPEVKRAEDLSLLADDEQVLRLLERNDGRMRQAKIVSETNWSDAKVSQLLSSMADDGQITKLRIGRENLISLPDVDALDGSKHDNE